MLCEFLLTINGTLHKLAKDCVKNWDEISYSVKRSDYGGVIRSFSTQFEFVNAAYELVYNEYLTNYLHANASIAVYAATETHAYKEVYNARLDFGSLRVSDGVLSISTFDDTLATLIKAKKNTQYEYVVDEIKASGQLYYDRLMMKSEIRWTLVTDYTDDGEESNDVSFDFAHYVLPIYMTTSEIATKGIMEVYDVSKQGYGTDEKDYLPFFKNVSGKGLEVRVKLSVGAQLIFESGGTSQSRSLTLYRKVADGNLTAIAETGLRGTYGVHKMDVQALLSDGEMLCLVLGSGTRATLRVITSFDFSIELLERDKAIYINVVKPINLLNSLLLSINEWRGGVVGEIATGYDTRLDNALIVAAESVRGIAGAKLYSSYGKFCDWMSAVFGFVPVITPNKVTFMHREQLFADSEAVEIGEAVDGLEYAVCDDLIYSRLRVGYDKEDYDSVNGRDEFRWTNEFDTGIDITDNTLELISPYRADAYGIEFLAAKYGEDTTDTSSDKDVFFVCATLQGSTYKLVRDGYVLTGVIAPATMFNAMYSPRSMIEANKRYIGVSIDRLSFASSDGNKDVSVNGVNEASEVEIQEGLFSVGEVDFTSFSLLEYLPEVPVAVEENGKRYIGYLSECSCKYGRFDGMKHTLIVKNIENI